MAKSPTQEGLYWLALDEGDGHYMTEQPLLVRVIALPPYGDGRIEFLDFPGRNPVSLYLPLLDEPHRPGRGPMGIAAFKEGSMWIFKDRAVKLRWRGPVKPPKMPKGARD